MASIKQPLTFTLMDEQEYHFLLTARIERAALQEVTKRGASNGAPNLADYSFKCFYLACRNKDGMSEDDFLDLCPGIEWIADKLKELKEHALRRPGDSARPTEASATASSDGPPKTTGSDSGLIGQPSLDETATSSGT